MMTPSHNCDNEFAFRIGPTKIFNIHHSLVSATARPQTKWELVTEALFT